MKQLDMSDFNHLVEIDAEKRELAIYRIGADGTKDFYTSTTLLEADISVSGGIESVSGGIEAFQRFAQQLGENILLDSPAIQKLYGL